MPLARWVVLVLFLLSLSACQTVPLYDAAPKAFSVPSSKENGLICINPFQIPKNEPGATLFLILVAAGGGNIHHPISASVFDVTDETRYIGTVGFNRNGVLGGWVEYEAPVGKRTLMLTLAGNSSVFTQNLGISHTDFIEVEVKPGGVNHVVLSRYGISRYPYLGEIVITDKHREYCLALTGRLGDRKDAIEQYMADNNINRYAWDFRSYCLALSEPRIVQTANEEARRQFAEQRSHIDAVRKETYSKWQTEGEKRLPYDLMRSYQPVNEEQ